MADSGDTRQRVLRMLSDGVITAEEANELLNALGGRSPDRPPREAGPSLSGVVADRPPPGLKLFRRLWQAAIFVAAGCLIFGAVGLTLLYAAASEVSMLALVCFWGIVLLAAPGLVLTLLALRSTWLYLDVRPGDGPRIALGLPMPLPLASGALRLARPFVPAERAASLNMAAEFVAAMRHNPNPQPLQVRVDDDDTQVEFYLG
jgi:hypothetical protein